MNSVVRRITKEDSVLLKNIRLQALKEAPHAFSGTYEEALEWSEQAWLDWADRCSASDIMATFFLFNNEIPIGMAGIDIDKNDKNLSHLMAMWISPEHRGTNGAAMLVEECCGWAMQRGATRMTAWVTEHNPRARKFYKKMGFEPRPEKRIHPPDVSKNEILTIRNLR